MVTIKKLITYQLNGASVAKDTPGAVRTESPNWFLFGRDIRGKQVRKATGTPSYSAAEKMVSDFEVGLKRGQVTTENSKKLRYEDIKANYLTDNPEQGAYHGIKYLDAFFGKLPVAAITTDTIREFIEQRREEDEAADPTIRRNLVMLRAMLNLARKTDKIASVPYFPMPEDSAPAGEYIPPADFARVLAELPKNLHPFYEFMYTTGCRLGAMRKIRWSMVSKDGTQISLPGSIIKSRTPLLLVLAGSYLEPIAKMLGRRFRDEDAPVFDFTNFRPEWNKAVAAAGFRSYNAKTRKREDVKGWRIHDCRCSAAINALAAGIDESTVLKIGGWKTRAMLDRYNVQHAEILKAAMEQAAKYRKQAEQQAAAR